MYGATSATPSQAVWPQPFPFETNLDKAKALLAEAGFPNGLDTTLSIDVGTATVGEPTALQIQENLNKIASAPRWRRSPAPTGAPC